MITQAQMKAAQNVYDSRAEPEGDEGDDLLEMIRIAEEYIGRAERCIAACDYEAAADYMRSAAAELTGSVA